MKMLILILVFLTLGSCSANGVIELNNVAKDTTIRIETDVSSPVMMNLYITGTVDDSFQINHAKFPGGKVERTFQYDWYSPTFIIDYKAHNAKKGKLKIEYNLPGSGF